MPFAELTLILNLLEKQADKVRSLPNHVPNIPTPKEYAPGEHTPREHTLEKPMPKLQIQTNQATCYLLTLLTSILSLALIAANVRAAEIKPGDWIWTATPTPSGTYLALTANPDKSILSTECSPKDLSCVYIVDLNTTCKTETYYPALLNSNLGAEPIKLRCVDGEIMAIQDYAVIHRVVKSASNLSIAIPRDNGNFTVSRFNLSGAAAVIKLMQAAAIAN